MLRLLCLLFAALTFLSVSQTEAATYYVDPESRGGTCNDSNPGTITQPVCGTKAGIAKIAPGDTLYLRGGRHNEGVIADPVPPSSSWENATVISSYPGEIASVKGISVNNPTTPTQYLIIKDLDVSLTGPGYGGAGGVTVLSTQYPPWDTVRVRFINLDVHHWHGPYMGVFVAANGVEYYGGKVHDGPVGPDDCNVPGEVNQSWDCHGFYWLGANTIIDGVEVYECSGFGMQIYTALGRHIVNNNIIRNNIIHHNAIPPAMAGGGIVIGSGDNNLVYNNIIYGNRSDGVDVGYEAEGTQLYNNTIYGNSGRGLYVDNTINNAVVRNNIVYANGANLSNDGVGTTLSNNLESDPSFTALW